MSSASFVDSASFQHSVAFVIGAVRDNSIGIHSELVEMLVVLVAFVGIAELAAKGVWQGVADSLH